MDYDVKEINKRIESDPIAFMAEADAAYHAQIMHAADKIRSKLDISPIVLLSGPSGSGKTTTALKIAEALKGEGITTHTISMDNYFLGKAHAPKGLYGEADLESPAVMDMELLDAHFSALSRGEEVIIPKFDFTRQQRNAEKGRPLRLEKNEIVVFEGIHALNDACAGRHPEATKLYISARSDFYDGEEILIKRTWLRLIRRAVRDYNFRGTDVGDTLKMWSTVRRGEKLYISPFKERADIIFDSSLPYEVSVMKHYAAPIFSQLPEDNPRAEEMHLMFDAMDRFSGIAPEMVAQNSLLREFIGGSAYKYH